MEREDWITVRQASQLSGYSEEYIRQLAQKGKIDARKFGWQVSINSRSLADYVARKPGPRNQEP